MNGWTQKKKLKQYIVHHAVKNPVLSLWKEKKNKLAGQKPQEAVSFIQQAKCKTTDAKKLRTNC